MKDKEIAKGIMMTSMLHCGGYNGPTLEDLVNFSRYDFKRSYYPDFNNLYNNSSRYKNDLCDAIQT